MLSLLLLHSQAAMYYIAGSSSSYFSRAVGQPRDQGKCLTCVAHAATEAVEMAVASAMDLTRKQLERRGLTASPLSLYYCAAGKLDLVLRIHPISEAIIEHLPSLTCLAGSRMFISDRHAEFAAFSRLRRCITNLLTRQTGLVT